MKQVIFLSLFILFSIISPAQRNEQVKKLVEEGIALHDKEDYDGAIKKYDAALAIDPNDLYANYEKSYSCNQAKKYKDCIDICKFIIKTFPDHSLLNQVYEVYGNSLDDSGNGNEAIKIYNEGLKKFPEYYMLHFNKGVTFMKLEEKEEALNAYNLALRYNSLHPSSNYYTGSVLQKQNRIPAMLAYMTFLALEPQTERSKKAFDAIDEIIYRNIKKDGGNTTISISMDMLDQAKDKKTDNNFGSVELAFSMLGTMDNAKEMDSITKTPADKFDFKLQMLINALANSIKEGKGFYWEHYVPFFIEMKNHGYTQTLSNLIYQASGEQKSSKWLEENEKKVNEFYEWLAKYKWIKD